MAWNVIGEAWYPCLAAPERAQVDLINVYALPLAILVPADQADLAWTLAAQPLDGPRWSYFVQSSSQTEVLIPVGEGEFERFYSYPPLAWNAALARINALPPNPTCILRPSWLYA